MDPVGSGDAGSSSQERLITRTRKNNLKDVWWGQHRHVAGSGCIVGAASVTLTAVYHHMLSLTPVEREMYNSWMSEFGRDLQGQLYRLTIHRAARLREPITLQQEFGLRFRGVCVPLEMGLDERAAAFFDVQPQWLRDEHGHLPNCAIRVGSAHAVLVVSGAVSSVLVPDIRDESKSYWSFDWKRLGVRMEDKPNLPAWAQDAGDPPNLGEATAMQLADTIRSLVAEVAFQVPEQRARDLCSGVSALQNFADNFDPSRLILDSTVFSAHPAVCF